MKYVVRGNEKMFVHILYQKINVYLINIYICLGMRENFLFYNRSIQDVGDIVSALIRKNHTRNLSEHNSPRIYKPK